MSLFSDHQFGLSHQVKLAANQDMSGELSDGMLPKLPKGYWNDVVKEWNRDPEKIKLWASRYGITLKQLGNSKWLCTGGKKIESGFGETSLYGLYKAIRNEFDNDFTKFQNLIGLNVTPKDIRIDFRAIVKAWNKDPDKIIAWANTYKIEICNLANSTWLHSAKLKLIPSGKEIDLRSLYDAIHIEFSKDFSKFKQLLGFEVAPKPSKVNFKTIVKDWNKDSEKIKAWAVKYKINLEDLGNSEWLRNNSREIVAGTGAVNLNSLYIAIFEEFGRDFSKFKKILGLDTTTYFRSIVREWSKDPVKIRAWANQHSIELSDLGNSAWLHKESVELAVGAGQVKLRGLYNAIRKEYGNNFAQFQKLLGIKSSSATKGCAVNIQAIRVIVKQWNKDPKKISDWAIAHKIEIRDLANSTWLQRNKRELVAGTGDIKLSRLYRTIVKEFEGDFARFQRLLGVDRALDVDLNAIVSDWNKDPEKIRIWAEKYQIDLVDLGNSTWLSRNSRVLGTRADAGAASLERLYYAILRSPDYNGNWQSFRNILGLRTEPISESLKKALSTKEGEALMLLAQELGEAALAEFLVAKHQNRFEYNTQLIENLRPYLGELEGNASLSPEMVPVGILRISELSHLRGALFNHYRDKYLAEFTKSLDSVVNKLTKLSMKAEHEEQKEFLNSIIIYFKEVEKLPHPERLRERLNGKREFPAKHQKIAIYECIKEKRILVADEMGGGKTGSAIGAFELLRDRGEVNKALVVCPAKALSVWKKALSSGKKGYFKDGKTPNVVIIENGFCDWEAAKKADYIVVSLEKTRTNGTVTKLKELGAQFFIFDEAHNAKSTKDKNSDTERIFAISQADSIVNGYTMLLSGTPIPNTLRDLAAQLRLLYAGKEAEKLEGEQLNFTHLPTLAKQIVNSNPLIVRNLLVRKMLRRKTEDCLPVGTTIQREDVYAELSAYDQAKYRSIVEIPILEAKDKLSRLRRVCLHSEVKYQAVRDAVSKALSREKYVTANQAPKIIIAESSFAKGVTRDWNDMRSEEAKGKESYLASRLQNDLGANVKIFVLDALNSNKRSEVIRLFSESTEASILLTLIAVVGEGLDITAAADGIIISPPYTVSAEEQFVRRMFRSGQKLPVHIQRLIFKGLIEHGIADYAVRKERVVKGVIDGRPLTAFEKEILKDDYSKVKAGGIISYETMSPRQQALWILSHIAGKGQEAIKAYLSANDGKFGRDFARGYVEDEDTSYSGNTARLVKSIVDTLDGKKKKKLIDIACGCRTLERMYEGDRYISVSSVDINQAALEVGGSFMKSPKTILPNEVGSMDSLSAETASKDIAILSLALDMSRHTRNGAAGRERANTLSEMNRVLKVGGNAILTFQEKLFDSAERFNNFSQSISKNFGFTLQPELTGIAVSTEASKEYRGWLLTLTKEKDAYGESAPKFTDELYLGLKFSKVRHESSQSIKEKKSAQLAERKSGSYHDSFVIGEKSVQFKATTITQLEVEAERSKVLLIEKCLEERIKELQTRYSSYKDIPDEYLLSISPQEVSKETQQARDLYFRALLEKYGNVEKVPLDEISKESDVVLIRGHHAKYGAYLALAKLDSRTGKKNGYGARYFFE